MGKISIFLDQNNNHIIGEVLNGDNDWECSTGDHIISVKNPAVIHIKKVPYRGESVMHVELHPVLYAELVAYDSRKGGTVWHYDKDTIVMSSHYKINENVINQYKQTFKLYSTMTSDLEELEDNRAKKIKI